MKRRDAVLALFALTTPPFACLAQQRGKVWRIGFLQESDPSTDIPRIVPFKQGMAALGYVEGRDYVIEQRSAKAELSRLPTLAAELVARKVDVIVPTGTAAAVAARKATREIPILIATIGDPVGTGLATSLARPGGNVTGLTNLTADLVIKRLDLLRQFVPELHRVGLLYDPNNPIDALQLAQFESGCSKLQLQPVSAPARNAEELAQAFEILVRAKVQALHVTVSSTNNSSRKIIIAHAAKHRLPAAYGRSDYAEDGGLIAYAADASDLNRRAAVYADRIFKGANPADLPIEQPTKFDLVVNLKTARMLGLKIPQSVLLRADRVIE
jgi:putative tryptophan/tyrosine transport system substrate-binding protein